MRDFAVVSLFVVATFIAVPASADFDVNNVGNGSDLVTDGVCEVTNGVGDCTLRAAIEEANATPARDVITFSITGCGGVCTISNPQLPTILAPVTINGYSQAGASANTAPLARVTNAVLLIELDGGTGCVDIDHTVDPTDLNGGSIIRGLVISGCSGSGISTSTPFNTIQGNFIGTSSDGMSANGNGNDGIVTSFTLPNTVGGNLIGGFLPEELNLISGNGADGIDLNSDGNLVMGNIIGADALGITDLGNDDYGIRIGRDDNEIGIDLPFIGSIDLVGAPIQGNLISGQRLSGIVITPDSSGNYLGANVIGVDTFQLSSIPNDDNGVLVQGPDNVIGLEAVGAANVIAGNGEQGVLITGGGATGNKVSGNFVGITFDVLSPTIYQAIGNGCDGVRVTTDSNTIGGALLPGQGNYIGGNGVNNCGAANGPGNGISVISNATGNEILGNWIGLDPNGLPRPNVADGIALLNNTQNTLIGDGSDFGANLIGPNGPDADDIAIDIDNNGMDTNDPMDADTGDPNQGQNYPVITSAVSSAGSTTVSGTLNSNPGVAFVIQVFSSPAGETGQARSYEGSVTTGVTDPNGDVPWSLVITPALPAGALITSLATPDAGPPAPSSELSAVVAVVEPGQLEFASATFSTPETGLAVITVNRVGGSGGAVSVDGSTSDGTAIDPDDYTGGSFLLSWADGDTAAKTFSVAIAADTLDELDETVLLALSNPTGGAALGAQSTAVLTILDDDAAPQISILGDSMAEGNAGTSIASFVVSLSAASGLPVDVDFATADGTATLADNDYQAAAGTVSFVPGATTDMIDVTIVGDTDPEPDETYFVNLQNAVNATISDPQGLGTILDDDTVTSFFVDDPVVLVEGDAGTVVMTFTVTLSPVAAAPTSVDVTTADGTATAGADYVALATTTVPFAAGVGSQPVVITVNGDNLDEFDETLFLDLTNPTGGAAIGDPQGTGTITDDDPEPNLSVSDVTLAEGNAGTTDFPFVVSLSAPSGKTVTVDAATADGTATAGGFDYQSLSTTLTFLPGDTTEVASVVVNGDPDPEQDEVFLLLLSNAAAATIIVGQGDGTILDDDSGPVFSINDVPVTEGDAGPVNASFTITLNPAAAVPTTIDVATADGTATGGVDYTPLSTTVTFAIGATSQTVGVTVLGDTLDELDETFLVNLTNATGGAGIGDAQGVGTITDNDPTPTVSILNVSQVEGNVGPSTFDFHVQLSAASGLAITVDADTADGTATVVGLDYVAVSATVSFPAGSTLQLLPVTVNGDIIVEFNEDFTVNLSNPTNTTVSDGQAVGTIVDDDGTPQVFIDDVSVTEGDAGNVNADFTVSLSVAAGVAVSVDFATADGAANAGNDYQAINGTATFAPGETTQPVTVVVLGDLVDEFDEGFVVDLSNPSGVTIADAQGQGTILDNDPLPGVTAEDFAAVEGDAGSTSFDITISLDAASEKTVMVDWATADGTATAAGGDYLPASGTLTIAPGMVSGVVSVQVNGDPDDEGDEFFWVTLTNPVECQIVDGTAEVVIVGDDGVLAPSIPTMGRGGLLVFVAGIALLGVGILRRRF